MDNILVSIIVPVYNVENYINRCVDSILGQTYKNIEILLIDDGSSDQSSDICDNYSKLDNRIRVFHITNSGVSHARNVGISNCKGQYITFIDSDDYVCNKYIELLMKTMIENKADFVYCKSQRFKSVDEIKSNNNDFFKMDERKIDFFTKLISFDSDIRAVWAKLYNVKLFDDIRFPDNINYSEDMMVVQLLANKCNKIVLCDSCMYYYSQESQSIVRSKYNKEKLNLIYCIKDLNDYININFPSLRDQSNSFYFTNIIYTCSELMKIDDCWSINALEDFSSIIKINLKFIKSSKYISKKNKIKASLIANKKFNLFNGINKMVRKKYDKK